MEVTRVARQGIGSDWQGKVPDFLRVAVFMLLYADDVVFIANDPDILQAQLQALEQYCRDWDTDANLSTTKVVVFRRPGQARLASAWQFAGRTVEVADSYKRLGTAFHETKTPQASIAADGSSWSAGPVRSQGHVLPARHHRTPPEATLLAAAGTPHCQFWQ
jgi:hypothetical protein